MLHDLLRIDLHLRYLDGWTAVGIFAALSAVVIGVGWRSLQWLGPRRQWTVIGVRLALLYAIVMLLGGLEGKQTADDLATVLVTDVSESTRSTGIDVDGLLRQAIDASLVGKRPGDRLGRVSFAQQPAVDALPSKTPVRSETRAILDRTDGTDLAAALQLGLASFPADAMKRLVLVSDGNATHGDLDAALAAATSAGVPVDVIPLQYRIDRDVMIDRLNAPVWRREGEPFHLEVVLRNAGDAPVCGKLTVTHQDLPIDLDTESPGVQPTRAVTLKPGINVVRVTVPPSMDSAVHRFRASFAADDGAKVDLLGGNNAAESFTFVRGRSRVLFVDNYPNGEGRILLDALRAEGIGIREEDHIQPHQFPSRLIDLQAYDAILLANVPRGPGGLDDAQGALLARYVHDSGGGLVVAGGPDALGAGNWQASELEEILPVSLEVPAQRVTPGGALVIVVDCSGSMQGVMPGGPSTKMQSAQRSALLALNALLPVDYVGVVAFDTRAVWALPLMKKGDHPAAADAIRSIGGGGGTNIYPALEEATRALERLSSAEAGARHILLLTDGQSMPGPYEQVLRRMNDAKITMSTIAIGADADRNLLRRLADGTGGRMYVVDDPTRLTQVFVREARTVRRSLIHEPSEGIPVAHVPAAGLSEALQSLQNQALPPLVGMVLTSRKNDPYAQVPLVSGDQHKDPILATGPAGLGRVAVFTSDATRRWAPMWVASRDYQRFWAQLVRSVARSPVSSDFDVQMVHEGSTTRIVVEAMNDQVDYNGLNIAGITAGPDASAPSQEVRLTQIGPGRYEATINTPVAGAYVTALKYRGGDGKSGTLLGGVVVASGAEQRELATNEQQLLEIARRTGGRVLPALGTAASYDLFDRAGVRPAVAYLPLTTMLLIATCGLLLTDVAVRRLQIDQATLVQWASMPLVFVRSITATRQVESRDALNALRQVRTRTNPTASSPTPAAEGPDPAYKFEAPTSAPGHLPQIVGGTTATPLRPPAPSAASTHSPRPSGDHPMSALLEAKRRAKDQMRPDADRTNKPQG